MLLQDMVGPQAGAVKKYFCECFGTEGLTRNLSTGLRRQPRVARLPQKGISSTASAATTKLATTCLIPALSKAI